MIRRVVTSASAVSLALGVVIFALWWRRGRVVAEHVVLGMRDGRLWEWIASEGGVEVIAVPGFAHPAVAAHNVYPRGPGTTTMSICEIEWDPGSASRLSPVRCLGMEFNALTATPALIRARLEWSPMAR